MQRDKIPSRGHNYQNLAVKLGPAIQKYSVNYSHIVILYENTHHL